jgi:hypothetical protein
MRTSLFAILTIALLIFASACQNSSISPTSGPPSAEQRINLNSPTGGLAATDEAPAFGEPGKFELLSNESPVADPYEEDSDIGDSIRARGARLYDFRAIWGRLADLSDSGAADLCPLDWSGTLHLEGGIIMIRKTIAFEPDDSIWRVDQSTIQWASRTGPHVDGIQVKLVLPARPVDTMVCAGCAPTLELSTGPYRRMFTIEELVALNLVEPVDTCGNAISITSVLAPPACPHGQLMGSWEMTPPDTLAPPDSNGADGTVLGVFRGIWVGRHGLIGGHLRGVFGLNDAGERVFFGKYIDQQGHFMGIVRGRFGSRPEFALDRCRHAKRSHGWFTGEWIDDTYRVQGGLKGHWIAPENGNGCFHGIWGMKCGRGGNGDEE